MCVGEDIEHWEVFLACKYQYSKFLKMKYLALLFFIGLIYNLNFRNQFNFTNYTIDNSATKNSPKHKLSAFQLKITFEKDNYFHNYVFNDGTYLINANVEITDYQHYVIGNQTLIIIETQTKFVGQDSKINGKLHLKMKYSDWRMVSEDIKEDVNKFLRKKIIEKLTDFIKK